MFRTFTLYSTLPPDKAIQILSSSINKNSPKSISNFLGLDGDDEKFRGSIEGNSFKIMRIIHYRNSFVPVIQGTFTPSLQGSIIRGYMRCHVFAILIMILIMSVFCIQTYHSHNQSNVIILFPLFLIVLICVGFYPEAHIAKNFLRDTFQAHET